MPRYAYSPDGFDLKPVVAEGIIPAMPADLLSSGEMHANAVLMGTLGNELGTLLEAPVLSSV